MKNQVQRKRNYKKLRKLGYTSFQANRFKDFSKERLDNLMAIKKESNKQLHELLRKPKR